MVEQRKPSDHFGKPGRLSGGYPLQGEPAGVDAVFLQDDVDDLRSGLCFVITFQVMAFTQVSAHDDDAVRHHRQRFADRASPG